MKRITLFFALLMGIGLTSLQAQSTTKSAAACCKKSTSTATADKSHCNGSADAAAKLASLDESIESRPCEKSGLVNYVRKETNPETGEVVFTSLEYNSELGQFAPSDKKACCTGDKMKCCSSKNKMSEADTDNSKKKAKQQKLQKGS